MRIDRKLNLLLPIDRDDGSRLFIHSTPISRQVFDEHFMLIGRAFSTIMASLGATSGPRVAAVVLRKVAEEMGIWDGPSGAGNALMNEIRRLTNVVLPVENQGWQTLPYETAVTRGLLSEDELSEAENAICFFIVASAMFRKAQIAVMLDMTSTLWGTEVTLLNVTEFANSLRTSKKDDDFGKSTQPLSHPH